MIPLRDNIPSRSAPLITVALIAANTIVFFVELSQGSGIRTFIHDFGLVPVHVTLSALLTSMFLHAGFLHLIGNMWFLWIFGDNIEDRFGHLRFLVFYVLSGVGAGIMHAVMNLGSTLPTIGASGAIGGVLGAYMVSFPNARIQTFAFIQVIELPQAAIRTGKGPVLLIHFA